MNQRTPVNLTFDFKADDIKTFTPDKLKKIRAGIYAKIKGIPASPETLKMLGLIKSELKIHQKIW